MREAEIGVSGEKELDAVLPFLGLETADGVDQSSAGSHERCRRFEKRGLSLREGAEVRGSPSPANLWMPAQNAGAGAWGINEHPCQCADEREARFQIRRDWQHVGKIQANTVFDEGPQAREASIDGEDPSCGAHPARQRKCLPSRGGTQIGEDFPTSRAHEERDGLGGFILDVTVAHLEGARPLRLAGSDAEGAGKERRGLR